MNRKITILYGSQTGCAKEAAERVAREAKRRWLIPTLSSMDRYDKRRLPHEKVVIFVCSTTGQGDTPDNMKVFWRFLRRKDLPSDSLSGVHFSVFGLGDSGYALFNAVARRLHQRLLDLGANVLYQRGLGDDQDPKGYEGGMEPWLEGLCEKLLGMYGYPAGKTQLDPNTCPPPLYQVKVSSGEKNKNLQPLPLVYGEGAQKYKPVSVKLTVNDKLTSEDNEQEVRHIVLDTSPHSHTLKYEPGDVVALHPRNPTDECAEFIKSRGFNPMDVVTIEKLKDEDMGERGGEGEEGGGEGGESEYPPEYCTLLDLFTTHLDIFGTPSRYFFECISYFAQDDAEKEKLLEFSKSEFQDDYYRYCKKEKRTYMEVLNEFKSVVIGLEYYIQLIPQLQPRRFSISSSPLAHTGEIHITLAVVKFRTPYKRIRTGVCSSWLASLSPGADVYAWVESGSIRMPLLQHPLVVVGPGTGIAPFRSMAHQRLHLARTGGSKVAPMLVFFGNRHSKGDYLYEKEWQELEKSGLVKIITAFSRDQEEKIYVQHRMKQEGKALFQSLRDGGYLIVAGNAKQMPIDVRNATREVVQEQGGMSEEDSRKWVSALDQQKRYITETWA